MLSSVDWPVRRELLSISSRLDFMSSVDTPAFL